MHYTKEANLRFIGHLDLQRLWERLLRRTTLPIRYSQGFHPRARLNLASALPLGFASRSEYLDFWMNQPVQQDEISAQLSSAALPGLSILSVEEIPLQEDSLQSSVTASEYEVVFFETPVAADLQNRITSILDTEQILRTRRNKVYDLRPLILDLAILPVSTGETGLTMSLKAAAGETGRPDEVLDAMGYSPEDTLVTRTRLIF